MDIFELVLGLLLVGALLTSLAQRIGAPSPVLLAVAGAALAFVPSGANATLDPELALALFVAPVLLDAAFDASPRDLKRSWLPVGSLVLFAVAFTVVAVAVVARLLVPDMPWSVAIVLGAIVAPPDAAAATAVLRALSPPHRITVILEGESLLNDATALIIYRAALSAAAGVALTPVSAAGMFLLACGGGALLGVGLAYAYMRLIPTPTDLGVAATTQFVGTFAVWIVSDRLGLSAVITTFAYAMTLSRMTPGRTGAELRRASYAVWEIAVFVLNALAFILVGLQLKGVLSRADGHVAQTAAFAGAVLATAVAVRIAWVLGFSTFLRLRPGSGAFRPPFNGSVVVAWCGMRGIVTLATALALPDGLPHRDLLIAAAFATVLGTLVIQGLTLAPLMRLLKLGEDDSEAQEVALARQEAAAAGQRMLAGNDSPHAQTLRELYDHPMPRDGHELMLRMIEAKRTRLIELRHEGVIGDNAFHLLEEELDWAEGHTNRRMRVAMAERRPAG